MQGETHRPSWVPLPPLFPPPDTGRRLRWKESIEESQRARTPIFMCPGYEADMPTECSTVVSLPISCREVLRKHPQRLETGGVSDSKRTQYLEAGGPQLKVSGRQPIASREANLEGMGR